MMQLLQPLSNNEPTLIIRLCEILESTWSRTFNILVFFCFHLKSIFLLTAVNQFFLVLYLNQINQTLLFCLESRIWSRPDSFILSVDVTHLTQTWFHLFLCKFWRKHLSNVIFPLCRYKLKLSLIVLFPLKSLIYTQPSPVCICQI